MSTLTVACSISQGLQLGDIKIFGPDDRHREASGIRVAGGFALTPHVDAEFFRTWLTENINSPDVLHRRVFIIAEEEPDAPKVVQDTGDGATRVGTFRSADPVVPPSLSALLASP